ncbi:MAG: MYXO-CTERM sorting domain-containing protein [Polyangiaceae bacterium]
MSDADCSGGFSCQENPEGVCSSTPDGGTQREPADPPKLCMPPYADLEGGGVTRGGTSTAGKDDGVGVSPETTGQKVQANGGCSVAHVGTAGSSAPFLLALGAALGLARRRRR